MARIPALTQPNSEAPDPSGNDPFPQQDGIRRNNRTDRARLESCGGVSAPPCGPVICPSLGLEVEFRCLDGVLQPSAS